MNPCTPYLLELSGRLRQAATPWPRERTGPFVRFVLSRRGDGGGFRGRAGDSDLYYTAFALRALHMLGALDESVAAPAAAFAAAAPAANAIDLLSKLFCLALCGDDLTAHAPAARTLLDKLIRDDGSYARSVVAAEGSTYHTFLGVLCRDMLCEDSPNFDGAIAFIRAHQRPDGGFAESRRAECGSVNPTAAALALLISAGLVADETVIRACDFLLKAQVPSGGWPAAPAAPAADLLSSFTAALSLADTGRLDLADTERARCFLRACRRTQHPAKENSAELSKSESHDNSNPITNSAGSLKREGHDNSSPITNSAGSLKREGHDNSSPITNSAGSLKREGHDNSNPITNSAGLLKCYGGWADDIDGDVEYTFYGLALAAIVGVEP